MDTRMFYTAVLARCHISNGKDIRVADRALMLIDRDEAIIIHRQSPRLRPSGRPAAKRGDNEVLRMGEGQQG